MHVFEGHLHDADLQLLLWVLSVLHDGVLNIVIVAVCLYGLDYVGDLDHVVR